MPLVQVKTIEGVFTPATRKEMIARLTETTVSIVGEDPRPVTWVVIEEVASGAWGIGGKAITTADIRELAAGQTVGA